MDGGADGGVGRSAAARDRDLERLLTFLDAIVAIAITLLVLPLVEVTSDLGEQRVGDVLVEHQSQVWAFLLSFVVIARLWWAQHHAVRPLVATPPRLFGALMAWSLTVVFLPFPTALVAQAPDEALTKVLYIGTCALSMLALLVVHLLVAHHPDCVDGSRRAVPTTGVRRSGAGVAAVNVGLLLVALAVTLLVPATSYLPLLLLAVDAPVARALRLDRPPAAPRA